ncbi:MAG TPA: hypothetical protein VF245_10360 [Solirubrobacterales bacterium]
MRLSQAAIVGATLSLALSLTACGAQSTAGEGTVDASPPPGPARAADATCAGQLRPLVTAMNTLRTDLAAGLSYDQYLSELRRVRGAHRRIRADRLQLGCLVAAGAPAERAVNRYIEAANAWGECLATAACETASIEPKLQAEWARASKLLSAAQAGI